MDSYLGTKPYFEESVLTTRSCSYSQNDEGAGRATNDSKQGGNLPRDAAPSFSEYHTCAVCGCAECQAVFSPVVQAIDLNGQGQSTHPKPWPTVQDLGTPAVLVAICISIVETEEQEEVIA